jgi:hypothetical protein
MTKAFAAAALAAAASSILTAARREHGPGWCAERLSAERVLGVVGRVKRPQPALGDRRQAEQPTQFRELDGGVLRDPTAACKRNSSVLILA